MTRNVPAGKMPRRRLLAAAAAAAGAAVAGGAGSYRLLTRGPNQEAALRPSPTTGSIADATPTPTPAPGEPLSFLQPAFGAFERAQFDISDTVDWSSGVFYMDVGTGRMTAYRRKDQFPEAPSIQASGLGPRFVAAPWGPDDSGFLLDRTTGSEWRWDAREWSVMTATESFVVFAERRDNKETGRHVVARADMKDAVEYQSGLATWTQWRARGSTAVLIGQEARDAVEFVDLASGAASSVFKAPTDLNGKPLRGVSIELENESTLVATVRYQGEAGDASYLIQRFSWDGELLTSFTGAPSFDSTSPDGRYRLRETALHAKQSVGEGSGEVWPAVVVLEGEDRQLLRIRSAALGYGDNLPRDRWLADSSAFVAMVHDPGEPPVPAMPFRYAVFSPAGAMELLPVPPVAPTEWYTSPLRNGPVPSPRDPDLLSFGRFYLYNRGTKRWFIPKLSDRAGPAHWVLGDSPWNAGPSEMVFSLGHGGHGGGGAPALIAPFVERAPFPEEPPMRFRVSGTGSCLNLREKPDATSNAMTCLREGTVVELDAKGEILWDGATQGYSYTASSTGTWVRVVAPGGLRGWVSAAYLSWT